MLILFIITGIAARKYHAKERALGNEWFEHGEIELKAGRPENAITDFRTALVYSPADGAYELSLAKALLAAHYEDEASAHLIRLWEHEPESGEVNLELGQLAIHNRNVQEALRYFHNSIYGDWGQRDAAEERREARLELYQFLVARGANPQAQAELMALAAELPPQASLHVQVGQIFFNARQYNEAQKQFALALQIDRNDKGALSGLGETDLHLDDYRNAELYLERALRKDPHNPNLERMLDEARQVLSIDPYEPGLPNAERMRRTVQVFQQAKDRLRDCAQTKSGGTQASQASTDLQDLYVRAVKMEPMVQEKILIRDADKATVVFSLAKEMEDSATTQCGEPTGLNKAIVLAMGERGGNPK
ncbi:MAG TPA: tetratricopeptide repeat protein [Terriglobia bacterium]|nr:tetratricopeptide repeat protein [Terriglobia bacterium]